MYEAFFEFSARPFSTTPAVDRYFPAETIEASRQCLARCIDRAEGTGLAVGPSGTGKTMLLQVLGAQFYGRFAVALLSNTNLRSRRALLQAILYELGLPYRDLEEGELRLALLDFLAPRTQANEGLLLLIDEAHALPGRLLEEVRMITNVVRDGQPRVRLVLAGNRALEERLAHPRMASLNQRIAARCYLQPFTHDETVEFVRQQLSGAGAQPGLVFTREALTAVHHATDGIPRLINQLCDHALLVAAAENRCPIDPVIIEQAWADVQQLPIAPPHRSDLSMPASESIVEFGSLSAEPAVAAKAPPPEPEAVLPVAAKPAVSQPLACEHDPFSESFADEEIILDRYVTEHSELPVHHRVSSIEGGALAAMLEPFLKRATLANGPAGHDEHAPSTIPMDCAEVCESVGQVGVNELPPRMPHEMGEDENVIVIEDDPEQQTIVHAPKGEVRRQEFSQLFASLRRG
ncbi:MAG TPA: AAA family ATPase [Pirellulales bacterium]|nr:AAA family ATPase [Pirellulales bacterium]